jgi:hypothetical protein
MIYLLMEARNENFNDMGCVGAFGTHDAAYRKMSELFDRCKGESDGYYTVAELESDVARVEDDYGNGMQWRIIETPGFVLSDDEMQARTRWERHVTAFLVHCGEVFHRPYPTDCHVWQNACHTAEKGEMTC